HDLPSSRLGRAALFSVLLCAVLTPRVAVRFDDFRLKLIESPLAPSAGTARVEINPALGTRNLRPPFAIISRIHNDSPTSQHFAVRVDDRTVCSRNLAGGGAARRVDCVWEGDWNSNASHSVAVEGGSFPWRLAYLELATHHGATRQHDLIIVPAASDR